MLYNSLDSVIMGYNAMPLWNYFQENAEVAEHQEINSQCWYHIPEEQQPEIHHCKNLKSR
jgi:hypothetical protein